MFFEIIYHFQTDLHVLVGSEGELPEQCIKILNKIAENGHFRPLLDECNRVGDEPLLGVDVADALVNE